MKIGKGLHFFNILCLVSVILGIVQGRSISVKKPDPDNAAATARWLVAQNSWGVLTYVILSLFLSLSLFFFFCINLYCSYDAHIWLSQSYFRALICI